MNESNIVILKGDGIGPEIAEVAKKVLIKVSEKENLKINIEEKLFGGEAINQIGDPLPKDTLQACKNAEAVLLAAIGSPEFDNVPREIRPETGLLKLRSELNLFANIRPVKVNRALIQSSSLKPEVIKDVDLVVVRELTGGIYFGEPRGLFEQDNNKRAFNTMTYSSQEIDRIAKVAFQIAKSRRKKICSLDKSNVLEVSQLWRDRVSEISKDFKDVDLSHQYIDNAAMQIIKDPSQFDVILTSNLFGDIISDEASMISGSIGMLPSASLGDKSPGLFEPIHGSAPDIANKNLANPIAMVLSVAMMMKISLKNNKAATDIENAVENVLNKGYRTSDIYSKGSQRLGCKEMGQKILEEINNI